MVKLVGPLLPFFCKRSLGDNGEYDVNRNAVNFQIRLGEMQIPSLFEKPIVFILFWWLNDVELLWSNQLLLFQLFAMLLRVQLVSFTKWRAFLINYDRLWQMTTTIKEIIMWAGLAFIEKDQIPILRYDTLYVNKIAQTILNSILGWLNFSNKY